MKRIKKSLKLGKWNLRFVDLTVKRKSFPLCSIEGKPLKESRSFGKVSYADESGVLVDKVVLRRLINGKPFSKFARSETIPEANLKWIEPEDAGDLLTEKTYWVDGDDLREHLKKEHKAVAFNFVLAQGYKVYQAVIQLFRDELIMRIGLGSICEEMLKARAEAENKPIVEVVQDRASPEEVLAIQLG